MYLPEMPYREADLDTSALALARYDARTSGDAPNGQLEVFLDEHFDNARMEHIYPNAKKVTRQNKSRIFPCAFAGKQV